ncbi:MAG TPA: hypothetical protein VID75_07820 [Acidimicrobiales bacterium]
MTDSGRTEVLSVHPAPEPAVLAAIMAAVEEAWPRPVAAATADQSVSAWRFSGRWWTKPVSMRRDRPG